LGWSEVVFDAPTALALMLIDAYATLAVYVRPPGVRNTPPLMIALLTFRNRLYYGWVIILCLAVTETVSYGLLDYAFTVFIKPLEAEFGWSRGEITAAFAIAALVSAAVAIPFGRWVDAHGTRWLMSCGAIGGAVALWAWSRVETLPAFYLVWALMGVVHAAVLYGTAFTVVAVWFNRRRGRALTVMTFIAGFASVIFIPLANALIEAYGWRTALEYMAVLYAAFTILPHALLLRRRPHDLGLQPDGTRLTPIQSVTPQSAAPTAPADMTMGQAVRERSFWWLIAAFMLMLFATSALRVHLTPHLIDQGYDPAFAASITGLLGVASLPGRLIFPALSDRFTRRRVTLWLFWLFLAGIVALLIVPGQLAIWLFLALFGSAYGAISPSRAALVAEEYGSANFGSIAGVMSVFVTLTLAAAPVTAGLLFDLTGSYQVAFVLLLVFAAFAVLALRLSKRPDAITPPVLSEEVLRA
jgi:MFS family permease